MKSITTFFIFTAAILVLYPAILCAEESSLLLKGGVEMDVQADARLGNEDSRHDGVMTSLDAVDRAQEKDHETKLKLIEESDSTAKDLQKANEDARHKNEKKDVERKRALEEKIHAKRVHEIKEKSARNQSSNPSRSNHPSPAWEDKSIPGRLMKLAGEMDRITTRNQNNAMAAGNEFFKGMSDTVSRSGKFLAQKPGTVLPQMVDGIVKYLNNDHNENDQALYEAAAKAVDEIQKNPARFFGEHAIDIAMSGAGAAGELAEARAAGAAGELSAAEKMSRAGTELEEAAGSKALAAKAAESAIASERRAADRMRLQQQASSDRARQQQQARQAKELEKAGKTLKGMADSAEEFAGFDLAAGAGPDVSKIFPPSPGTKGPVNFIKSIDKAAGNEVCFPVALAAAKRLKTGKPYVALDHNPHVSFYDPAQGKFVYGDVATDPSKIVQVLKREFGNGNAKNPFHSGLQGLKSHQEGLPVASSQVKIEGALEAAGEGSQGLVFVDAGNGTPGHVFNVSNNGGKIEFMDYAEASPVQYLRFGKGNVIMQSNGVTASVPLNWDRVFFYRID